MKLLERESTGAVLGSVLVVGLVLAVMIPGCPIKDGPGEAPDGLPAKEGSMETTTRGEFEGILEVVPPEYDGRGNLVRIEKTDAEWMHLLTPDQYKIVRRKGTEPPYCGNLLDNKKEGVYVCVACGLPLFRSDAKFTSGTGWPSFFRPVDRRHVAEMRDGSHGMDRMEILCARCDGHLGHVFEDGPRPTGLRYCVNSESLRFVEAPHPE